MTTALLTHRLAGREDLPALKALMDLAIAGLQKPFLDDSQIASSRMIMGLDTQLVDDGTYFVVQADGELAGCGGWSRRATLYGGINPPGAAPRCSTRRGTRRACGQCTRIRRTPAKEWAGGFSRYARKQPGPKASRKSS